MAKVDRFEDLVIWQKARELSKDIYSYTNRVEFKYDARFVQQIRAAAGSVMDNIAEGFERAGNKEFINFLYIAKGSCGEVRSQIARALDAEYINEEEYRSLYTRCINLTSNIMKFISSIAESEYKGSKYNS
jgi:four helix bundle protein